jgi:hypothetical protein
VTIEEQERLITAALGGYDVSDLDEFRVAVRRLMTTVEGAEREACAVACDDLARAYRGQGAYGAIGAAALDNAAKAIRKRGEA